MLLCVLAFLHIVFITTSASAEPPPVGIDTMLWLDLAMAPHRGVGGTVYTMMRNGKSTSVCVLPRQESLHPITFADFDMQFGLLYKISNYEKRDSNSPENGELEPIAVLDALQGCYVHNKDRSTQHQPPCFAFLNATADDCLRGERESLFFTPAPTAVEMLAIYITRYLPQRANMREMIAQSAGFEIDMRQAKLHLDKNKAELSSSEYEEVVFNMKKQVDALLWKHRVVVDDKWKLLQSWLNTTTSSACSAVYVLPQWLLKPQKVTVEDIVDLVRHSISTLFVSEKKDKREEEVLLMERAFCATASFAIAAIFMEDLNFLQMKDDLQNTGTLGILETVDNTTVDRNLRYLQQVVKEEWNQLRSIANPSYWKCLGGIFLEDTPTIPSVASCFTEDVMETRWNFLMYHNSSSSTSTTATTTTIVVSTSNAQRMEYLFAWPSSKPIRFDTVQTRNSAIQTGLIDIPLREDQIPSFPTGVVGSVGDKHLSNGTQQCPVGTFALVEDNFYCRDCVNKKNLFIYCPGDGVVHSCANKPSGTDYVPTGLRPSSPASCHYHCIDPYMFILNGMCDFVPGYYMNNEVLANCIVPNTLIGPLLLPYHSFVGSGAPNIPESCSYVLRRRVISEKISQLPSPLQWCGSNTNGFSIRFSTVLSVDTIRQHHEENYGEAYLHRITSIAYELVSIIPNGWSWYLISYVDPTLLISSVSAIKMQLAWNASFSSDLFFSANWTLYERCSTCTGMSKEVELNLTLSWDPILEEVAFFVNDDILGTPIPHRGVKEFLMGNCADTSTQYQITMGGWKAAYKSQVEFLGRISSNQLPLYFEYLPGEMKELLLRNRPLSLLQLPANRSLMAAPANTSFAAAIFTTATSMMDLARLTNKLQQESRNNYFLPGRTCRVYSQRDRDEGGCFPCPVGSYALLPDEMSKDEDAFCQCLSTRHMRYNQKECIPRSIGYGAPVTILMMNTNNIFLPLTNSTSPIPLVHFIVNEYTRPTDAVNVLRPKAVASVDCTPGFNSFTIRNSPDDSIVEVLLKDSLGFHGEMCTISGSVQMYPFLESPKSKQHFTFNFRAPPLESNNLNVNVSTTLAKDQYSIWLQVTGYSLLQPNAMDTLQLVELKDEQLNTLRESLNQTFIHAFVQCDSNWNVSRVLSLDNGVLLPVQEGRSCTLNLTVVSGIKAFSPSTPLIFTIDSCVDGRSEGLIFFNSNLSIIIFSIIFFLIALLTALLYSYSALRDGYKKKKEFITSTSNG
ncbi:uncharacterized protein TM35_000074830 [Trypanosoma theileri]|uniref:Uncharacterized protein n=1 Tax=Trypanosoma theileri TaxID=67003 RepID=A0A1X0P3D6_9TRYP|nr:uncharacterized protein TM35_000074830 [Trypanosoma theileri]ORC91059.1 hypothetical protein TM35_000074830 [Trypanosoma theileri]